MKYWLRQTINNSYLITIKNIELIISHKNLILTLRNINLCIKTFLNKIVKNLFVKYDTFIKISANRNQIEYKISKLISKFFSIMN